MKWFKAIIFYIFEVILGILLLPVCLLQLIRDVGEEIFNQYVNLIKQISRCARRTINER